MKKNFSSREKFFFRRVKKFTQYEKKDFITA